MFFYPLLFVTIFDKDDGNLLLYNKGDKDDDKDDGNHLLYDKGDKDDGNLILYDKGTKMMTKMMEIFFCMTRVTKMIDDGNLFLYDKGDKDE